MPLTSEDLERLADHLLRQEFEDKRKNKSRKTEFPILSPSQLKRRMLMEIPYSNLSERQRLECRLKNLDYYSRESD
jgi:hypothetical protein